jgi:prepilin-type N-terminal cleavage/methylation domain-containing protein
MKRAAAGSKGFTVVELLIALAILGIIAAVLLPNVHAALEQGRQTPDDPDRTAQKQTVADMRNVGTAMFSWLTDEVGAAAAGESSTQIDLAGYPSITRDDLTTILVPTYVASVPSLDGWHNEYEYWLNVENPLARNVMAIRSGGRDGRAEADVYTVTGFEPGDYDRDIVWVDGFFVRWPQKP